MVKQNLSSRFLLGPHSEAKLELYEKYLNKYLLVLLNSSHIMKINIYDIFCGTGIYSDGKKGSPIIAFDCIRNVRAHYSTKKRFMKQISLIINDGCEENIQNAKRNLIESNSPEQVCDLQFFNYDASAMFQTAIESIQKQPSSEKNLLFIDPFGYKEIQKSNLLSLLETKRTEIILFLPISHMQRFLQPAINDPEKPAYAPLVKFLKAFFEADHPVWDAGCSAIHFIHYLRDAFSFSGSFYSADYYIQRDQSNYYALFFMTSNLLGLHKILESKWELDESEGLGFELPKLQASLFGAEESLQKQSLRFSELENLLKVYFREHSDSDSKKLYEFILKNGFLPKHANHLLKKWQSDGILDVKNYVDGSLSRKGAFYLSYEHFKERIPKVRFNLKGDTSNV